MNTVMHDLKCYLPYHLLHIASDNGFSQFLSRYYRQYNLYKYIFSSKMRLKIAQCLPMEVEEPLLVMQSLISGVQIAEVLEPANPDFSEKNCAIELIESS
jgi:hypothetical protein